MKVIIFHAQGNANVRHTVIALCEANILDEFHTTIAVFPDTFLFAIARISFLSDIRRRSLDIALKKFTHASPFREVGRLISLRLGWNKLTKQESGYFSVEKVISELDNKVALRIAKASKVNIHAIYAYEDGAMFSFIEAKKKGIKCIYDLPTGYWRAKKRILEEQIVKFPEWRATMSGIHDSEAKLERKDNELKNADYIIVASRFTASTLLEYPGKLPPVKVVPYGFPEIGPKRDKNSYSTKTPVKLLFVGSLSQQKGLVNLFHAVNKVGNSLSLTIVGRKPLINCPALDAELVKHNWIPSLSNQEILQLMRKHDILVFPTLFDGFGLVITEAMSQGTPVIATYNSAGPDLIQHGKNGWLIDADSTSELQLLLNQLIQNPIQISQAGFEAMETAKKRPWSVFREELSKAINCS